MGHVITISREFGSMGRQIGRRVAELLGYKYLDRDILEATADKMDVSLHEIMLLEDNRFDTYQRMAYPFGFGDGVMQRKMFQVQAELIREYAAKEDCVIIGRCADYVLRDYPNVFSVFIYATYLDRIENSVTKLGIKASEAKIIVDEVDYARNLCYKKFTSSEYNTTKYRDLLINSSVLGGAKTAELIVDMSQAYFSKQ